GMTDTDDAVRRSCGKTRRQPPRPAVEHLAPGCLSQLFDEEFCPVGEAVALAQRTAPNLRAYRIAGRLAWQQSFLIPRDPPHHRLPEVDIAEITAVLRSAGLGRLTDHLAPSDVVLELVGELAFFAGYTLQMRNAAGKHQGRRVGNLRHTPQHGRRLCGRGQGP